MLSLAPPHTFGSLLASCPPLAGHSPGNRLQESLLSVERARSLRGYQFMVVPAGKGTALSAWPLASPTGHWHFLEVQVSDWESSTQVSAHSSLRSCLPRQRREMDYGCHWAPKADTKLRVLPSSISCHLDIVMAVVLYLEGLPRRLSAL